MSSSFCIFTLSHRNPPACCRQRTGAVCSLWEPAPRPGPETLNGTRNAGRTWFESSLKHKRAKQTMRNESPGPASEETGAQEANLLPCNRPGRPDRTQTGDHALGAGGRGRPGVARGAPAVPESRLWASASEKLPGWWLKISRGGSTYTTGISRGYKSGSVFPESQS